MYICIIMYIMTMIFIRPHIRTYLHTYLPRYQHNYIHVCAHMQKHAHTICSYVINIFHHYIRCTELRPYHIFQAQNYCALSSPCVTVWWKFWNCNIEPTKCVEPWLRQSVTRVSLGVQCKTFLSCSEKLVGDVHSHKHGSGAAVNLAVRKDWFQGCWQDIGRHPRSRLM